MLVPFDFIEEDGLIAHRLVQSGQKYLGFETALFGQKNAETGGAQTSALITS